MSSNPSNNQSIRPIIRTLAKRLGGFAFTLLLGWLALAWNSGLFIPNDERWAVTPGEFTDDGFSSQKKILALPDSKVAYLDVGQGPVLILLHGCPFSVYEWNKVIPELAKHYRVIAPDLRGLGDTPVRLNDDYRLLTDVKMLQQLMDTLAIKSAYFVAHDHGGAIAQLLMQQDPTRIQKLVLTNVEAYDQWPSKPEIPTLKLIVNPSTSPLMYHALQFSSVQQKVFSIAFFDDAKITADVARGYSLPHVATAERWQRLRRFFAWQLDPAHSRTTTLTAVPAMRAFQAPTLLLWGEQDGNFGPQLAQRLARDIPGVQGIHYLHRSEHMPFEEEPTEYTQAMLGFMQSGTVAAHAKQALAAARASQE
ncbi:MAG: alpha/beta hydrolase [Gammaproteobacteria bacterium]|nr:alpha/beta hydrolase [Gammaproteobacteria bacterium]